MYNKYSKKAVIITIIFDIILIINLIISLMAKNTKILWLSIINIIILFFPFIITYICNKKKIYLPQSFQTINVLFIMSALYLGEINNFYNKIWWWDLILHAIFGTYMVIISLHLIKGVIKKEKNISHKRFEMFRVIFAISFTTLLGTLWELFEFTVDYFFKYGMVKGGLEDTFSDLMIKIAFACITSVIMYRNDLKKCYPDS